MGKRRAASGPAPRAAEAPEAAKVDVARVTLALDPETLKSDDTLRVEAIQRFCASCPSLATEPQRFVLRIEDMVEFARRQRVAWDGMPDEVRFMRLFLLLSVANKDLLSNFLESGRFVGRESDGSAGRQKKIDRAFMKLLMFNTWGEGASAQGPEQLVVLKRLCPPVPFWWRKLRSLLSSPVVPVLLAMIAMHTLGEYFRMEKAQPDGAAEPTEPTG